MKKNLLFFTFLWILHSIFAQFESKYSQYTLNTLVMNPAISGSENNMVNVLAYRHQWMNNQAKLHQKSFTTHLPFNQQRMGFGLILFDESSKIQRFTQISTNFSYKINAFKGLLAFGMEGGFIQQKIDFSDLTIKDNDDVLAQNMNKIQGDFSAGTFYQNKQLYLGFSVKHLAFNELGKNYFLHTIYVYDINRHVKMMPSFLLKYREKWQKSLFDLNVHFKFYEQFWLGISYQNSNEMSLQTGIAIHKINQKMNHPIFVGYSYDYGFSALYPHNIGSHEIVMKLNLKPNPNPSHILNKKRYVSPLFF